MKIWQAGVWWAVLAAGIAWGAADSAGSAHKDGDRASLESKGGLATDAQLSEDPVPSASESEDMQVPDIAKPIAEETAKTEKTHDQIPEKFRPAYFSERPGKFLIDPQKLLDATEYRKRLAFLNDHATDSSIDLFVYVFTGDQDIPGEVRADYLIEKFFVQERPAVVLFYFMGAPQRSSIHLSPTILAHVPPIDRLHALESSIMKASEKQGAAAQFEAFLVQISIHVCLMEQMMGGSSASDRQASLSEHLAQTEQKKKHGLLARLQPIIDRIKPFMIPASALAGALIVLWGVITFARRRSIYQFPEFDVEPRLGGAHAAGVGAVISFASSALPPTSQRDQTRDYLRRS